MVYEPPLPLFNNNKKIATLNICTYLVFWGDMSLEGKTSIFEPGGSKNRQPFLRTQFTFIDGSAS